MEEIMNQVLDNPVKNQTMLTEKKYKVLVILAALMVTTYLTANIMAVKLISVFGLTMFDAGTITFPLAYMLGDVVTEIYGFKIARKLVWLTFFCNIILVIATSAGLLFRSPDYMAGTSEAYKTIFTYVPRILIASLVAFLVGEISNSWFMEKIKKLTGEKHLWVRTIGSSMIGYVFDTVLFVLIAFAFEAPAKDLITMILAQYAVKVVLEAVGGTPLAYAAIRWINKEEDKISRYSLIREKLPREFLLLQGRGCRWKQCAFCDYHLDVSNAPYKINKKVLCKVTGEFGVLDIINSGSCTELDDKTVTLIARVAKKREISTLWFEAHWSCREELRSFAERFPGITVKFRTGVETFDGNLRNAWKKGIASSVSPLDIAVYFKGICLLVGVKGQTKDMISDDIGKAQENFEYFSVNVFMENSTDVKRDNELTGWFIDEWLPKLKDDCKAEILLDNTDLGVG